jgi:hypothetical protein
MDLGLLMELAGKGEQVAINSTSGLVVEDFYRVVIFKSAQITSIKINGNNTPKLATSAIKEKTIIHSVTEIELASGVAIGYKEL